MTRNPNLVKSHHNYTVGEIANLLGIHKNTVRQWIKKGLPILDDHQHPMLVLGHILKKFLKERKEKNKRPCKPGELYCFRCRIPKPPAGGMADYEPVTEKFGNLKAICPDCDCLMNKRISLSQIRELCKNLDISFPRAQ